MKLTKGQIVGITGSTALTFIVAVDLFSGGDGETGALLFFWLIGWAINT